MPIINLKLKTNNGTKTYIDLDCTMGKQPVITNTGLTNLYQDQLNSKSDDCTYDSTTHILTLPITIQGLSKTINATVPDSGLAVGDTNILSIGNNEFYVVEASSTTYQVEPNTYYWIADVSNGMFQGAGLGDNPLIFKSNNEDFVSMNFNDKTGVVTYVKSDGNSVTVFDGDGNANENYRQIIITTAQEVSEDFYQMMINDGIWETTQPNIVSIDLTTLSGWSSVADGSHYLSVVAKADGYKDSNQSDFINFVKTTTTAHTLTWISSIIVTVNGSSVTSPYALQNGDTIVLKRASSPWYNAIITAGENTYDTDTASSPISISNSDIIVENGGYEPSPSLYMGFTINYTETSNGSSGGAIN